MSKISVAEAETQLRAYDRIVRATLMARGTPGRAPVFYLSDEQLSGLFAPRQLETFVRRGLTVAEPKCSTAAKN